MLAHYNFFVWLGILPPLDPFSLAYDLESTPISRFMARLCSRIHSSTPFKPFGSSLMAEWGFSTMLLFSFFFLSVSARLVSGAFFFVA